MGDVRLTDLEIIQRYSIAVRGETADRDELVTALRADLAWLEDGRRARRTAATEEPVPPAARRAVTKPARQTATPKPASRTALPKPPTRRATPTATSAVKKSTKPAARRGR